VKLKPLAAGVHLVDAAAAMEAPSERQDGPPGYPQIREAGSTLLRRSSRRESGLGSSGLVADRLKRLG
jgi:hypothetical protein